MAGNKHLIHARSNATVESGTQPKLPEADRIQHGEIAINYHKGMETISLKNDNNEVVKFSNDKKFEDIISANEEATSQILGSLDERITAVEQGGGGGTVDQVQSNWAQTDNTKVDFIKNKPTKLSDFTNDQNFTSNVGTVTGITMNSSPKTVGNDGVVNLGTVITEHQSLAEYSKKSDTVKSVEYSNGELKYYVNGSTTPTPIISAVNLVADGGGGGGTGGGLDNVSYDTTNKKLTKTLNGTPSDVVTSSTIVTDGGAVTEIEYNTTSKKFIKTKQNAPNNGDIVTASQVVTDGGGITSLSIDFDNSGNLSFTTNGGSPTPITTASEIVQKGGGGTTISSVALSLDSNTGVLKISINGGQAISTGLTAADIVSAGGGGGGSSSEMEETIAAALNDLNTRVAALEAAQ